MLVALLEHYGNVGPWRWGETSSVRADPCCCLLAGSHQHNISHHILYIWYILYIVCICSNILYSKLFVVDTVYTLRCDFEFRLCVYGKLN